MGVTSYLTWEGEILSETRSGVESDYLPDPLSSTAALLNSSQVKTDTFSWWPFGEQRTHVGTSVTPFGFLTRQGFHVGSLNVGLYGPSGIYDASFTSLMSVRSDGIMLPYAFTSGLLTLVGPKKKSSDGGPYDCTRPFRDKSWQSKRCKTVRDLAFQELLRKGYSEKDSRLLSEIMQCIASGESDCKSGCSDGDNFGLYQLDQKHMNQFGGECKTRPLNATCNTDTAINLMMHLISKNKGSLGQRICWYWGVLYCKGRKKDDGITDNSKAQGLETMCCLKAKGIDLYSMNPIYPK